MECTPKTLKFKVTCKKPELITPFEPTPREFKPLSDLDDQESFRMLQIPAMGVYKGSPSMQGKDPVKVIRDAIAKALVFYYPFAGRLREIAATRKLVVECTGEGILFVEADADLSVNQLADAGLHPPFPNLDQLLYDFPTSHGILDSPLVLFQVTRLKCGGFTIASHLRHVIADGVGIVKFWYAISELARGARAPSIPPVWARHLLSAQNPPRVSFTHPEYDIGTISETPFEEVVERAFFFTHADISALHRSLPPHSCGGCSKFDVVSALVWRCRTLSLSKNPNQEVRLYIAINTTHLVKNPPLPLGYYGNTVVGTMAVATADEFYKNTLDYVIDLVRKAKAKVNEEYLKSTLDLISIRDRPSLSWDRTFHVSDLGHLPTEKLDFGWGKPLYCGVAKNSPHPVSGLFSWFISCKNKEGESGTLVPICLPHNAMDVFTKELNNMMEVARKNTMFNASAL